MGTLQESPSSGQDAPGSGGSVSVVMASWNAATTIDASIRSVLEQTHPATELVVVDGASTDGTRDVIERYSDDIAYWESTPDRGVYDAWNKALGHVTGEWLCFLGADDRLARPDVLERLAPHLADAVGEVHVVYASLDLVDAEGALIRRVGSPWPETRAGLAESMTLPNPATFYHRSLFDVHGRFDDSLRIVGDYEFLLRELVDNDAAFVPDLVAVEMLVGGLSSDPAQRAVRAREVAMIRYRHGLTRVPPWAAPSVVKTATLGALAKLVGDERAAKVRGWYRRARGRAPED